MGRVFTMRKFCSACFNTFTITSAASVYCQARECKNKRRRDARSAARDAALLSAWNEAQRPGSAGHLEQALKGE